MSSLDHIVRGFKATLVAKAVYMGSSALLMVLLARFFLDPDGYGLLFWTIGVLAIVQLVSDLGLGKSVARYVSEYRELDPGQIPHLLERVLWVKIALLVAVCAALLVGHDWLAGVLGEPEAGPFLAAGAVYVVAHSFYTLGMIVFQGYNRLVVSAAIQAIGGAGRLLFVVVFVLAGFGALGAFFGYVVGYALAAAVGLALVYLLVYRRHDRAGVMEPGLTRRLLEYSVPLTATRSANVIDKQVDTVLVGALLNPAAVAFYTLGKQITEFVLAPADSLGFTISPNFGEHKAAGELDRAREIYETALSQTLLVYVPAAAGLAIVADPFVTLVFGADYAGAVPVLQLLAAFVVLQAITFVTSDGLDYLGRARHRAMAKGGTSVANLVLNLALIPTIGVVGAALATVLTHSVYVAVNLWIMHSELSLRVERLARTVAAIGAITGAMAGAVLLVAPMASNLFALGFVIGLGIVTWGALAVLSGLVDPGQVRSVLG